MMQMAGPMEEKTDKQRQHVKDLIKQYWQHTSRAHEEVAAAASILRLLADEVNEQTYLCLIIAGTRPLIMMEVPQMVNQATEMKLEHERQEKVEDMQNQPIEQIIEEQNIPVRVER